VIEITLNGIASKVFNEITATLDKIRKEKQFQPGVKTHWKRTVWMPKGITYVRIKNKSRVTSSLHAHHSNESEEPSRLEKNETNEVNR
jgi:hypothetical protein